MINFAAIKLASRYIVKGNSYACVVQEVDTDEKKTISRNPKGFKPSIY